MVTVADLEIQKGVASMHVVYDLKQFILHAYVPLTAHLI